MMPWASYIHIYIYKYIYIYIYAHKVFSLKLCPSLSLFAIMFQRNQAPATSSATAPEVEFLDDVQDMYAENVISAARATVLLKKAQNAGIKMAIKAVKKAPGVTKKTAKNLARNLRRHYRKNDKWPDPYWFQARVWDRVKDDEVTKKICILLPSEVLQTIWKFGVKEVLLGTGHYDKLTKDHHEWMKQQLNVQELLGFGLHGDGVPCNYDRTESANITSINLPGLTGRNGRLRIPLFILPDHCFSANTFDDIYEVIAWDLRSLLTGCQAECRHDTTPWDPTTDKRRSKLHGDRDFRACLVQVRSDWDWLVKCYHFPAHGTKEGMCWMCQCKRNQVPQQPRGGGAPSVRTI
jgi:hypothetical protein